MYIASKNLTLWHFETNLSMPEEVAFILRKSRVNTDVLSQQSYEHDKDGQTDRQTAFQLYIVNCDS